jgi:membrane fusion protein (multidrug efflux system)
MADNDRPVTAEVATPEETAPPRGERRRTYFREHPRAKWIALAVLLVLGAGGFWLWHYYSGRETTDDAQVDGYITPISAKVGGTVRAVHVEDNQYVEAGKVLVEIDPRDYQVALDRARADLAQAEAAAVAARTGVPITATTTSSRLRTAQAGVGAAAAGLAAAEKEVGSANAQVAAAEARVREAEARNTLAQQNLARMKQLVGRDEISQQQYDAAVADANAAAATMSAARAAAAQAEQLVPVAGSHVAQAKAGLSQAQTAVEAAGTWPEEVAATKAQVGSAAARVEQARAAVAQAELNLQYTTVKAPAAGVVSRRSVDPGQVIAPGQPLLAVVLLSEIWVTANFKETQLHYVRVGQPATLKIDAYGGREYRGRVNSIAAATGARFSLLPPENATGNFVKVVQRVPVKIMLEPNQDPERLLRPGMSVDVTVLTR